MWKRKLHSNLGYLKHREFFGLDYNVAISFESGKEKISMADVYFNEACIIFLFKL